ncbi:hypothetical protein ACLB2K_073747 [Fragaria x ananassa]
MAKEQPAFPLALLQRKDLLKHVVELVMDGQKKVLIGLFVRLLIQGEDEPFKLDRDAPVFFKVKLLEELVARSEWEKVKDYLLKFVGPAAKIFTNLINCSENETITDINKNISMLLWEVEAEKNRSFNELRISKELQSSIPDIPLLSLVEAVKGCVDVQDETALMAMVEDFKLKAARKRERSESTSEVGYGSSHSIKMPLKLKSCGELKEVIGCHHHKRKDVEIIGYRGITCAIQHVNYLIENAVAVKKLVINPVQLRRLPPSVDREIELSKVEENARDHAKQHLVPKLNVSSTVEFVCL